MVFIFGLLFLFPAFNLQGQSYNGLWIVGEHYVSFVDQEHVPHTLSDVNPTSWGFNASSCQLWVSDESSGKLLLFASKGNRNTISLKGAHILSDINEGNFFTRNGQLLQKRADNGNILKEAALPWTPYSESVAFNGEHLWSLNYSPNSHRFWLTRLDNDWKFGSEQTILEQEDTISHRKLMLNRTSDTLWLGYSVWNQHPYSPVVEKRGTSMELLQRFVWNERGLFFDMCADSADSAIVSRDRSSNSGYTIPIFSYLEKLAGSSAHKIYESETNWFIDTIACLDDRIYFAERSIFGSDGSHLVFWNRKDRGQRLFRLPAKAHKIFSCSNAQ